MALQQLEDNSHLIKLHRNGTIQNVTLDIYIILDEERLSLLDTKTVLENIGKFGFGRDASIGLGQFNITSIKKV